ncbi:MAG: cyclic nucleotide-binding domain-containing protein, partial [Bacteroidota bacterium]
MKPEKISEILKQTEVFAPLPKELLTQLGELSYPMAAEAGEVIIRKGDDGDSLYLITNGKVKVHDENQIVAECGRGEIVGELALLDRGPRSMNVTTLEPTSFLLINRETFFHLLKDRPDVTEKMIGLLTQRLRNQNLRLVEHFKQREEEMSRLVKE